MTICQAYNLVHRKGITPWMAWGIMKWNNEYIIVETQFIKKHKDAELVLIRKGACFPGKPLYPR